MSIRGIVRSHIIANEGLTGIIPEDRWYSSGSIDEKNRPDTLFAVLRYGPTTPGMGNIKRGTVDIWVHDVPGSYGSINRVIALLYGRLHGVTHLQDSDGNELMSADWVSDSADLYDPGFRTIARTTSYNLIGKGV